MTSGRVLFLCLDDRSMVPASPHWMKRAEAQYRPGEVYHLVQHHERSDASHNHFFAALNKSWQNLPEDVAPEYPTSEHLRKKALIACGYANERAIVCASKAEALRLAAFIRAMDDYAVIAVSGAVVRVWTAKSQSYRAMGKAEFTDSKRKVLDYVAGLLRVTPKQLEGAAS